MATDRHEISTTLKILAKDPLAVLGTLIALAFLSTALVVALFGSAILPYDPNFANLSIIFLPISLAHPMGTDFLGRDILSRVLAAAPIDAQIAFTIVGVSAFVGILLGSVAGYFGGSIDESIMRVTDMFLAFPTLVLAVAVAVALGPGVDHLIEANLVVWWPVYARMARAGALSLRESQFVEAARAAGLSQITIIRRHIIPNNISPILIYGTLDIGNAILYTSVLSYLGLGAQPPQAEWGRLVFDGQVYLTRAWWVPLMPGLIILLVALGFCLVGDALRDALDPRYRR
ncbi:MAG TPA: ABC transporter permease [archaeon]|nr:ABC transporter permease [archaeon]